MTPNGVDPAFTPGNSLMLGTYVLAVGAVQPRKNQLAALAAAEAVALPLVVAGPVKDEALARELRSSAAPTCAATSPRRSSSSSTAARRASCSRRASRASGCRCSRRWRAARPWSPSTSPRCARSPATRPSSSTKSDLADGVRRALDERERLVAAGLERARAFSWRATAERTLEVYREALAMSGLRGRRLARPRARARGVAAGAGAAGRRARRDREPPGQRRGASCRGARAREPAAAHVRSERERRRRGNERRVRARLEPGRGARAGRGRGARRASPTHTRAPASSARSSSGRTARWQPSLRRFPTVLGTLWRRTPLRLLRRPYEHQTSHYGTRPAEPVQGDWLLGGACLLMRRSMLEEIGGWDAGFRHYVEDIDVAYRAAQAGWERWLVPDSGRPPRLRRRDRQALPQPPHALAPARDGALRAQASRAPAASLR